MIPNPPLSALSRKIAFSTFAQYVGKAVQLGLGIITVKYISNFLEPNDYGIYKKILEFALFFSVAANLGIFANIVRSMSDDPQNGKLFINSLFLRIVSASLFFIMAILFLIITGKDQVFLMGSILFFGALLFDYISGVCDGMLQANYLMGRATFALITGRIINFICLFIVLQFFFSLPPMLLLPLLFLGTVTGSFVTAALSFYFVQQKISLEWKLDASFAWKILKISWPFGVINIINGLYFRFLPDYFSANFLDNSQFATFSISFTIAQNLSLFSTFLMFSALPGLKQYIDQKHWHKAQVLYKKLCYLLGAAGIILVIIGSLLGPQIIELLTHKKYFLPEFWFVLPLMLVLAAISYGYDLMLITLFALQQDYWFMKREFLAFILALICFLGSFYVANQQLKLWLIIFGSIVGELTMVILGSIRVKTLFKGHAQHATHMLHPIADLT